MPLPLLSEAERLTRQALATDSSYQSARAFLALTLLNQGRVREGDSVLLVAESDQSELTPGERAGLDWQRGLLDGDQGRMYRSAKRMTEVDPSLLSLWILGFETARSNRPRESVAIHARIDPYNVQMEYNPSYWTTMAEAQHMLGEHAREAEAAVAARKQYPTFLGTLQAQAIALAALGRASEAERLLEQSVDLPVQEGLTPGMVGRDVALELRAHGDPNGARRASAWTVRWYEALPTAERRAHQRNYAEALYAAERWADAGRALTEACGDTTTDLGCLGLSGTIAARLGRRDAAQQISERISTLPFYPPREEGIALRHQAHIAAALGEQERALRLLRQAMEKGLWYSSELHRQPDLQLLAGYAPFVEFLRPKG